MSDNSIDKAIEVVQAAADADSKGDHKEAFRLYNLGVKYFLHALKYEKNESYKKTIREKVNEYLKRAEELKIILEKPPQKAAAEGGKGTPDDDESAKFRNQLMSTIMDDKPNVRWTDVIGLDVAKNMLHEAIFLPLKFPQLFSGEVKRKPWKGILLYGPPGTGKSYLAKAIATEADSTFFNVTSADLVRKWVGEGQQLVRHLFALAREKAPSIIFIDEIDGLMAARNDSASQTSIQMLNQFLMEMEGIKSGGRVLVLGATNVPWLLDAAIMRRFQKRICIDLPDVNARSRIFKTHLGNTPNTLQLENFRTLAERTEKYSASDIGNVVQDAMMQPVRKVLEATHFKTVAAPSKDNPQVMKYDYLTPCSPGDPAAVEMTWNDVPSDNLFEPPVTFRDFEKSLSITRPSVREDDRKKMDEFTDAYGMEGV